MNNPKLLALCFTLLPLFAAQSANSSDRIVACFKKELYAINADGSDKRVLLSSDIKKGRPAWSPDGKSIAYLEKPTGKTQLWTMDIHSGQRTLVSDKVNQYSTISWSGDSKRLVFIDNKELLSTIKVDGSDKTQLSDRKGFYEPFWY
jgi:TolB protein